jgi:hypothetical protein
VEQTRWKQLPWGWLALGAVGVTVRLWLWWNTYGSNDSLIWALHGQHVFENGLARTYELYEVFNHSPLMGFYARWAWVLSGGGELAPGAQLHVILRSDAPITLLMSMARFMKLPGLLGEGLVLWALWRFASPRAFALYALLPAPILVSGYHGNTDCLYAALVLLAALAFDRERYFLSGLLWSASLNVKLLPLALLPIVLLGPRSWRAFGRLVAGGVVGLLPFVPYALTTGASMYRNMITYNSIPDSWGVMGILNFSLGTPNLRPFVVPMWHWYSESGRYVVLAAIAAVALLSRWRLKLTMTQQAALGAALFFLLTPGFGVQYVVFAVPVLCFVQLGAGVRWGWAAGLTIGLAYWSWLSRLAPPVSWFEDKLPGPAPLVGMLAWAVLAHFVWSQLQAAWRGPPTAPRPAE